MNDEFNDDPMSEFSKHLESVLAKRKKEEDCYEEANAIMEKDNDSVEKEILMAFWTKVGNAPHTYYMAMQTVHQFINALDGMRNIKGIPEDMHLLVAETLAKCAEVDAKCLRIIIETKAKHNVE